MRRNWSAWIVAALLVLIGLCLIGTITLPYSTLKSLTDSLLPDHNFNSLKPWNAPVFKIIFGAGGLFFLGLAALTAFHRWGWFVRFWKRFWLDLRRSFVFPRLRRQDVGFLAGVVAITFLAVVFRMERANAPMAHDEAYTYVAFSRSLFTALTDYSKPNNHVFHSILVFFSTRIFGMQAWAVRLPAFLAGVLLVPASYWMASRFYDRWTALGAAFLVAWFPPLVAYANDARGYTMVALFSIVILALGDHVRKDKNVFLWILISLFSALGLYTVPTMMFPLGILFVWLFLENQVSGPGPYRTRWEFIKYWFAAGVGAALLTLVCYTPILIFTDPSKFFANDMLAPVPWKDLLVTLSARFTSTWAEWTLHVPIVVVILLVAGWVLSLFFHWKISRTRIPLQLAAILWIAALLLVKRPDAEARFWSFFMPLLLIWASAGILGLLQKVHLRFAFDIPLAAPVVGLLVIYGFWHAAWLAPQLPAIWAGRGKQENVVLFVQSRLQPDDLIVVSSPDDAAVWYYSYLHGIPDAYFNTDNTNYARAIVLVDSQWHQTLSWVIGHRGPDRPPLNIDSAQLLGNVDTIQVYGLLHE